MKLYNMLDSRKVPAIQAPFFILTAILILSLPAIAAPPTTNEITKYLVIAMGDDGDVGRAFQMSNSEIGADREVLSTSGTDTAFPIMTGKFPNLFDVFDDRSTGPSGPRWNTGTDPDQVTALGSVVSPGEGIDYSGESALTSDNGRFDFSNSLVFADIGIQGAIGNPVQGASNSFHADIGESTQAASGSLGLGSGATGNNNFAPLLTELGTWKTFIEGLTVEKTISSSDLASFQNNEANNGIIQGTSPNGHITTYGSGDEVGTPDGIIVIDITLGGSDFDLANLDWAIIANDGVLPIFRLRGGSNMKMSNVSILVNNGQQDSIGAIFYSGYEGGGGNTVFDGSNIVLNGVGLWDLNAVGEGGSTKTQITINNGQGCAQFISQKVDFQNNRWTRCVVELGPTAIEQVSFTAEASDNGITVSWETGTEIDNVGFNIYRAPLEDGEYVKINDELVPAAGDAGSGGLYSYVDALGQSTDYYKIEDVDSNGVTTMRGPITTASALSEHLFLPLMVY